MSMSPGRHFLDPLGTAHLTAAEPAMIICEAILFVSMTMQSLVRKQRETHLRLPGDEVQVALLFGEEVVDREPRTCILQYLIQSASHRPLDQLDAESFFLVCRHVNDTRGAKDLLAGQDHVEHVSGFEVGRDVGEDRVGHVAERGRGGPHLLGGRIHGDKGSGGVVASSEMCPFNFPSEKSIQLPGTRRANVRKPTVAPLVEFHCPPRGPPTL